MGKRAYPRKAEDADEDCTGGINKNSESFGGERDSMIPAREGQRLRGSAVQGRSKR